MRQISAAWYLGRFDCHAPAASAANQAFNVVFPPSQIANSANHSKKDKHREAILFCANEILNAIKDNLLSGSQQYQGKDSKFSVEEADARCKQVVASSLDAYSAFWEELAFPLLRTQQQPNSDVDDIVLDSKAEKGKKLSIEMDKTKQVQLSILNESKFWKLSQDKESKIKAAWYKLIGSMIKYCFISENQGQLQSDGEIEGIIILNKKHLDKIASATLGHFDDTSDPIVVARKWQAALYLITKCKDWTALIDVEKRVINKLMSVLEKPSHPTVIYPSLLPLLSRLPQANYQENINQEDKLKLEGFYKRFFVSFRRGAEKEFGASKECKQSVGALGSYSNNSIKSCVNSYFECVIFGVRQLSHIVHNPSNNQQQLKGNEELDASKVIYEQVHQLMHDLITPKIETEESDTRGSDETKCEDNSNISLASNRTTTRKYNERSNKWSLTVYESAFIEGYGHFIKNIDHNTSKTEGTSGRPHISSQLRNIFWENLISICSKLHTLSVNEPHALKYLQVLLSALYEEPQSSHEMGSFKHKKQHGKKLRFADFSQDNAVKMDDESSTKIERSISAELQKITLDLTINSLSVVLNPNIQPAIPQASPDENETHSFSNYYSDQVNFIRSLLVRQKEINASCCNDKSAVANFYDELWAGIQKSTNCIGNETLPTQSVDFAGQPNELELQRDAVDFHSVLAILNTLSSNSIFTNEYLKQSSIRCDYADLYLLLMDVLPLKVQVTYLSSQYRKWYEFGKSSPSKKVELFSPFEWMLLIIERMDNLASKKGNSKSLECVKNMAACEKEGTNSFSVLMSDIAKTIFDSSLESKSEPSKSNENILIQILSLVIKHSASDAVPSSLEHVLKSLHSTLTRANEHLQIIGGQNSEKDSSYWVLKSKKAIHMIADIFEQRPGVWFNTSSIEQRMDLIVTMFKISTCVTHILSDQDHNDITNVWYNAVNSFTQLDSTSGVQKQYIQPISEMFVQYVRNRLSYLSAINDTNPDKLPLQPSIEILARQTWKFLSILTTLSKHTKVYAKTGLCWRDVLSKMVQYQDEPDIGVKKRKLVQRFAERTKITSFPAVPSLKKPYVEDNFENNHNIYERISTTSCQFFIKICKSLLLEYGTDAPLPMPCLQKETIEKHFGNRPEDIKMHNELDLFCYENPEERCICHQEGEEGCVEKICSILIDIMSFIQIRHIGINKGTRDNLINLNDKTSMDDLVFNIGGWLNTNVLDKSLRMSLSNGCEHSLCLEQFLCCLPEMSNKIRKSKDCGDLTNRAGKMALDIGLLTSKSKDEISAKETNSRFEDIEDQISSLSICDKVIEEKSSRDARTKGYIHTAITIMQFLERDELSSILMTEVGRALSLEPTFESSDKMVKSSEASKSLEVDSDNHTNLRNSITSSFILVNTCLRCISSLRSSKVIDHEQEKEALLQPDEKIAVKALLQLIWNWRQNFEADFLFSCDIFEGANPTDGQKTTNNGVSLAHDKVTFVVTIVEFMSLAIQHLTFSNNNNPYSCSAKVEDAQIIYSALEASHWDLILCALSSWIQSIEESNLVSLFQDDNKSASKKLNLENPSISNKTPTVYSDFYSLTCLHRRELARNFGMSVSCLTTTVSDYIAYISQNSLLYLQKTQNSNKTKNNDQVHNITEEWQNFFADGIYSVLLNTFVSLASRLKPHMVLQLEMKGKSKITKQAPKSIVNANLENKLHVESSNDILVSQLLNSLGSALRAIPDEQLFESHDLPAKFNTQDIITCSPEQLALPDKIVFLLNHLFPLLPCKERSVQTTTFHLLNRTMKKIAELDNIRSHKEIEVNKSINPDSITAHSENDTDECKEIPKRLAELLQKMEPVIDAIFKEFELSFGEPLPAPMPRDSAAYNTTLTYLMTWHLIITLIEYVSGDDLRPKYSEFLRRGGHLESVMMLLFHTMSYPLQESNLDIQSAVYDNTGLSVPILSAKCQLRQSSKSQLDESLVEKFQSPPLNCECKDSALEIKNLARYIYHAMLKYLPALVRNWWNLSDKRTANIVENFTINKIAPSLWNEEVNRINGVSSGAFDNMTIKVRTTVREVVAVYSLGDDGSEGSMELVIQLPANFPLGAVQVESGKRVGVTTSQWRTWMLQLTTFLQHQNGSIVDGLTVWKKNVDKRFQGVEECYICFYVLHGTNHQLPKLACRTCKKKFHAACLYKWFSTSNNSTCPLCRNLF